MTNVRYPDRRRFLQGLTAAGLAAFTTRGVFAQQLVETGTTTEGPFYPDKLPLDTDNDLIIINDAITPAVGEITHLTGRVLTTAVSRCATRWSRSGRSTRRARTSHGRASANRIRQELPGIRPFPQRFEGAVRLPYDQTDRLHTDRHLSDGTHPFRHQPERAPRLHVADAGQRSPRERARRRHEDLDPRALKTLLVDFNPLPGSKLGELRANFDIVLGSTVNELEVGPLRGVAPSTRRRSGGG